MSAGISMLLRREEESKGVQMHVNALCSVAYLLIFPEDLKTFKNPLATFCSRRLLVKLGQMVTTSPQEEIR